MSALFPWPASESALAVLQEWLARRSPPPVQGVLGLSIGACFVGFPRGEQGAGAAGDPGWAAAVRPAADGWEAAQVRGTAGAPYRPGLLALREGPLLEAAVRALSAPPDLLVVNATGRDHPRRAGLALHLGAALGIPTVGVTDRPLCAEGTQPAPGCGSRSPLRLEGELVGYLVRTRSGARPVVAHAAWRTDPETAVEVVLQSLGRGRTPEPLAQARRAARLARARDALGRPPSA